jgi:hypothetical protein
MLLDVLAMSTMASQSVSPLVHLFTSGVVSVIAFWYTLHVDSQFAPAIDSHIGIVFYAGRPFVFGAAAWSAFSLWRLVRATRVNRSRGGYIICVVGAVLAIPSLLAAALSLPR